MTWRTHLVGGVSSLWVLAAVPGIFAAGGALAAFAALGSLLPDLDAYDSKIRHLNLFKGFEPFVLPGQALHRMFGHRGLLHSGWGIAVCGALAIPISVMFGWQAGTGLLLGYASHIALDACTRTGVPFLYPSSRRFWLLPPWLRVVTGSPEEDGFLAVFAIFTLLFLLVTARQASGMW